MNSLQSEVFNIFRLFFFINSTYVDGESMDKKSVIIIGIDGLGGKFITGENAPFIHSLFKNGSYSTEMQSVLPTVSGPNWMSLFTGVDSPTHGIQGNGKEKSSSTTLFEMLPN